MRNPVKSSASQGAIAVNMCQFRHNPKPSPAPAAGIIISSGLSRRLRLRSRGDNQRQGAPTWCLSGKSLPLRRGACLDGSRVQGHVIRAFSWSVDLISTGLRCKPMICKDNMYRNLIRVTMVSPSGADVALSTRFPDCSLELARLAQLSTGIAGRSKTRGGVHPKIAASQIIVGGHARTFPIFEPSGGIA